MNRNKKYYIGLMSGTSTDGVDAVLTDFPTDSSLPSIIGTASLAMPADLRTTLLQLNQAGGRDELHYAYLAASELARLYAQSVNTVLEENNIHPQEVIAIGAHGQTIRHQPDAGYTIQLNNPALLAELTGIDVIADFRSRDIAAGGQGAPLIPAFHDAIFSKDRNTALLNIGGISNLTLIATGKDTVGFDVGPGNMLMDSWCAQHTGENFDKDGDWGAQGQIIPELLAFFIESEPWFKLVPPKSTGRDLFNMQWLNSRLKDFEKSYADTLEPQDVQATLRRLTAQLISDYVKQHQSDELIVFGGGAFNKALMQEIARLVSPSHVMTSADKGIPEQYMEALTFAWLAKCFINKRAVCSPAITGARHSTIAGCWYPA